MSGVFARVMALAALLLPAPALADVTARYSNGDSVLTIQVADNGDAYAQWPGKFIIIRRGGVEYTLIPMDGELGHVPLQGFVDLAVTRGKRQLATLNSPGKPLGEFASDRIGAEAVGGYAGTMWQVSTLTDGRKRPVHQLVFSADPLLAPVGDLFRTCGRLFVRFMAGMSSDPGNAGAVMEQLMANGTPIRINRMKLESVDTKPIAASRFALPGKLIDIAALDRGTPLVGVTD